MITSTLRPSTAKAVDAQVEKVLRGLGFPEHPLDLSSVRELLRLDKKFYSTERGRIPAGDGESNRPQG